MRLALTVVAPAPRAGGKRAGANVVLDADPDTRVGDVGTELARQAGYAPAPAANETRVLQSARGEARAAASRQPPGSAVPGVFVDGQQVDPRESLAKSPIRDGCIVSLADASGCPAPEEPGLIEIRVASGPAAGAVYRLSMGQSSIGTGELDHIRLGDQELPEHAVRVTVDRRGSVQVSALPAARAMLDREPLTTAVPWRPGMQLAVGASLLDLAPWEPPDAALQPSDDGTGLDFNRPPRLLPPQQQTQFRLPSPPGKPDRRPLPFLMALMPLAIGVGGYFMFHSAYMLLFTAMSPVMMVGQYLQERKQGRTSNARQQAEYRERKGRIEQDAREALESERVRRRSDSPDPATVAAIASGPRRRLWERRRSDPDYLLLRCGTADLPSAVVLEDPTLDEHRRQVTWRVPDAPVTVPLPERGVLGVAGPGDAPRAIGRWLLAQAAALHSPNDLQVCVLTEPSGGASWDWVRWLPHARPDESHDINVLVGNDTETVAARIAELQAVVTARQEVQREAVGQITFSQPDTLVVLDGSRRLRSMPGIIPLLRDGPAVGVYAICLDADERLLPAECQAVAVAEGPRLRVQQTGELTIREVRPDYVSTAWCARVARGLAPIRDVSHDEEAAGLPDSSRLLDLLRLDPPNPETLAGRWRSRGRTTLALVGESLDGPFGIDLRRDGPHSLIAGTTGAGKSELLQTVVASLAVANRPDAMTFVLVDYKGGSAFKDCVHLPHTVGMVTDLDAHLVERALESLTAELTRREHILAAAGAKDIEDYTDALDRGARVQPMPRLLIVIDEFASMARDLPDFITGLVNIAQRGRSLGIHLILATQRPAGVVTADIRANTNLRIALRVTDPTESSDVIDAPDAARISKSTPGRAYVRLGHSSLVPFQTARVGGRRPGAKGRVLPRPWTARLDWSQLGRAALRRPPAPAAQEEEITDLGVLVQAIRGTSDGLRLPAQHSPWLPPLPLSLLLGRLRVPPPRDGGLPLVPYGVDDLPSQQQQRIAAIDLRSFGHLLAAGAPRTGRSQLLRTIAGSIASHASCADVHLYGIDCGNGALLGLTRLPHCGAVVGRTQTERAIRLISRLTQEVARRQELLAAGGFADCTEQRAAVAPPDRLPHIIVLLDRWEGFLTSLGDIGTGELTEQIYKLLSEGASAGVHLIITGDQRLVSGKIGTLTENKMAFRLSDKTDFSVLGVSSRKVPVDMPPGRALRNETAIETQVALLTADASGPGQAAALDALAAEAAQRDAGVPKALRPFRVDMLPSRITFEQAWQLRPAESPLFGLVGVGGDELAGYGPDLTRGMATFVVAGPMRSGRSSVLVSMARSFLLGGAQLVLITPRPSPLRALASEPGVVAAFESSDLPAENFAAAVGSFTGPGVVLMDDAEMLKDCSAADELTELMHLGADRRQALVLAGDASEVCGGFGTWQTDAKKARRGSLLAPQDFTDGDLIGIRIPRDLIGQPVQPGRALLHLGDGQLRTVQVPFD
ncbi:MAG: type VII secretion protein EccCb [Nocardiopsaceae bacterium]|nr:type VII secretion protein EccCb [Nocardiopsaceae bacterium]